MAGRTRYRNPLAGWDRRYEGTVGSGDYYYGPMLKADAEEKFRASLAVSDRVLESKGLLPLPLSLVIRPGVPFRTTEDYANSTFTSKLAAQTKSVGMLEYVYGRTGYRSPKPGDPSRETPHTLFNCLHRLCEFISQPGEDRDGKLWVNPAGIGSGDIAFLPCLPPAVASNFRTAFHGIMHGATFLKSRVYPGEDRPSFADHISDGQYMGCLRAILSSGLNTASGRLGAIDDPDQALAEAFAKFCLSRDRVYDPNVPLTLNGKPISLQYGDLEYIQNLRKIWGTILEQTAHSLARVFGLFVRAYYSGKSPILEIGENRGRSAYVEHIDSAYDHLNSMLPRGLTGDSGQPLAFVKPRTFEETHYAAELYKAVSALFKRPSREAEHAAGRVVSDALHDLLDRAQLIALKNSAPRDTHPEYRFLREKYARARNTPASIAKAQKVNAALDVLEARSKPRPGLYSVFIQPQE